SAVMPPGHAWADTFGVRQIPFGIYSIVFGIATEILYIPCMIGLGRDLRSSCIKVIYQIIQIIFLGKVAYSATIVNLMFKGAVFCSHPTLSVGVGIAGYGMWCSASACCLVLAMNRICEMLNISKYFTKYP
ncbi:hypothetical protein PMAYCL1PPCAC_26319, partial [Pristionchus mayeri]